VLFFGEILTHNIDLLNASLQANRQSN